MKLFNQSILLQAAVILVATLALWVPALAAPVAMPTAGGGAPLYNLLVQWLQPVPLAAVIIAMVAVVTEGVMLNLLLANAGLTSQNSLLPTLLFIIAMSAPATTLTPMVPVAALTIACLQQLTLKGTLLTISVERACAATAMIGLASLFYLPATLLILSYMLVAINYRLYSWKDWAAMILGFIAPYVLLATVLMFTGGLQEWWQSVTDTVDNIHPHAGSFTPLQAVCNVALAVALLAGMVSVWSLSGERTVVWQKNASNSLTIIVGALAILAVTQLFPIDMQLVAIPFAFCLTCLLTPPTRTMTRRKRKEWVYTLILILIFIAALIC